jgi:hypothetical protein
VDPIEMSGKEIKRLEVLRRLVDAVLSQRELGIAGIRGGRWA